jgi:predicted transcriptional regulator
MSRNSEAFLTAFSRIEIFLRHRAHAEAGTPFHKLVKQAATAVAEVNRYQDDLREFAHLRNAIVHHHDGGRVIAEPHRSTVSAIGRIAEAITNPPTVGERFKTDVVTVQVDDSISTAAAIILNKSFSQLPVMNMKKFVGLLTTNTIARWFGACSRDSRSAEREATVQDVLSYAEDIRSYDFIKPDITLARVIEYFSDIASRGCELSALLIVDGSETTPRFRGIITVSDLPRIVRLLQLS